MTKVILDLRCKDFELKSKPLKSFKGIIYSGSRLSGVHLTLPSALCLKTISPVPHPIEKRYIIPQSKI